MVNEDLIVKYLAGEAEPHEEVMLNNWISASDENKKLFESIEKIWKASEGVSFRPEVNVENAWNKVSKAMDTAKPRGKQVAFYRAIILAAAMLVLVMGVLWLMYKPDQNSQLIVNSDGVVKNIILSDGSKVQMKDAE